jgi:hypothetical protein
MRSLVCNEMLMPYCFSCKFSFGFENGADTSMLLSHHQNVGQNQDIKIANRSFENVPQIKI